jgi:hypothetical protein
MASGALAEHRMNAALFWQSIVLDRERERNILRVIYGRGSIGQSTHTIEQKKFE